MGFLLKEALKTLCGRNQCSYAVFWKIGCQNSKLLIWEECYYGPLPCPFSTRTAGIGTSNFSFKDGGSSQLGSQEGEQICSLIKKMMVNSSVNIAGEGIIGRAAFTGNHEWILLNNFTRDAYPLEVYNELHHQFSAGMQTVAVIPVLPHGVVQLGSPLAKMENIGLINEARSLILQLGCIPGALLSEDYSAKASPETLSLPATIGVPVSMNPPIFTLKCTPFMANGSDQQSSSSQASSSFVQPSHPLMGDINNHRSSLLTHQSSNLTQLSSKYNDNYGQSKATAMMKQSFGGQSENRVMEAEAIPSNLNSGLQQHLHLYNARSAFDELTGFGQTGRSDYSIKFMEQQILSSIGNQDHVIPTTNASSTLKMTQLKTNGGHIPDQSHSSVSTSLHEGIPMHDGMNSHLRPNIVTSSFSNPPGVAAAGFSGTHTAEIELEYDSLTGAGVYSLPDLASQSSVSHKALEGLDQKSLPADLKHAHDVMASTGQTIDDDLHQALKIPSIHLDEHVPVSGCIPGIVNDCLNNAGANHSSRKLHANDEELCARPSLGEDLFDVLGVNFKSKLLTENSNMFFADELDANAENVDKKSACVDVQAIGPDCYSINETISDNGVFSGSCTDHLLDAVVSKAQSVVKQDSNDISCKTTLTRISNTPVPSPTFRQPLSNHVPGGLFNCPKTLGKNVAAEASSLRSGSSKGDAGNCSQTTSIYGSQLSSWVENASNIKHESSVSTGYSKRPDEVGKSANRKRLKPGENPRPRPKDRQMIQDRVKELREIVPNGAKCSIDALLERTIKHMLFLQSVTKHADKLKQTGESKIISKEGGLLLKDNFEGGATWAYEVGSQSMVCPIIVEDLNPPRQMLVEMLCEERGFFLEIADLIRGMGLTILKGVMEARNDKIWARFAVEANRDVTRMEIFMSLVRLLDQTGKGGASSSNPINNDMLAYHSLPQATQIPATGMPGSL